jgi:hypothetical protein
VEARAAGGGAGEELAWRWAALMAYGREAEQGAEQAPEEEEGERGPKDFLGICKNLRDLTANWIFPLI